MLRRHARGIIIVIIVAAFLAAPALALVGGIQEGSGQSPSPSQSTDGGTVPEITDFRDLSKEQRRMIVEGSPGMNLTDRQKKEFIDTGMITTGSGGGDGQGDSGGAHGSRGR